MANKSTFIRNVWTPQKVVEHRAGARRSPDPRPDRCRTLRLEPCQDEGPRPAKGRVWLPQPDQLPAHDLELYRGHPTTEISTMKDRSSGVCNCGQGCCPHGRNSALTPAAPSALFGPAPISSSTWSVILETVPRHRGAVILGDIRRDLQSLDTFPTDDLLTLAGLLIIYAREHPKTLSVKVSCPIGHMSAAGQARGR